MLAQTLLQIWKNKGSIVEGITNAIFKKEDIEEVFDLRNNICNTCDQLDTDGSKCAIPGTGPCCGSCGCSLKFKLRSLSATCPLNKWEALMSQAEEDLFRNSITK